MGSDKFSCADLPREKILFTNTRFWHQDGDPTKPPDKAKVNDVQPVDGHGNVLLIYGSSLTARVSRYLIGCPGAISSEALTNLNNSNYVADSYQAYRFWENENDRRGAMVF